MNFYENNKNKKLLKNWKKLLLMKVLSNVVFYGIISYNNYVGRLLEGEAIK